MVMVPMSSVAFLVVFLVVMGSATMGFTSPASVNIYNLIEGPASEMQVECGDFPEKTLRYGKLFGWGFPHSRYGTRRWACVFRWGIKVQRFFVWVDPNGKTLVPFHRCLHCAWLVKAERFYVLSDYGEEPPVLIYSWI